MQNKFCNSKILYIFVPTKKQMTDYNYSYDTHADKDAEREYWENQRNWYFARQKAKQIISIVETLTKLLK